MHIEAVTHEKFTDMWWERPDEMHKCKYALSQSCPLDFFFSVNWKFNPKSLIFKFKAFEYALFGFVFVKLYLQQNLPQTGCS